MARSRITSPSKDLVTDDGAVMLSFVEGEQLRFKMTFNWVTNLTDHTVTVKVLEADMDGPLNAGKPTTVKVGGISTTLPLIDTVIDDNTVEFVIPSSLIASWSKQPEPNLPVYGWIGVKLEDPGTGNEKQIWKFMRGLVEVLYSPTQE